MKWKRLFQKDTKEKEKPYWSEQVENIHVFSSIKKNAEFIQQALSHTEDLKDKFLTFNSRNYGLFFIETLVDRDKIHNNIIKPLLNKKEGKLEQTVTLEKIKKVHHLDHVINAMIDGYCVCFIEGRKECYLFSVALDISRDIQEPSNEKVVRGSHEGLIESLNKSIHLTRKRIENPNLVFQYFTLGKVTKTKVAISYIKNLANPDIINEIKKRLKAIKTDDIQTPGNMQEYIEDYPFSPFPQMLQTERPDSVAAHLNEGRIALFMEGSPSALIFPVTFFAFFQSSDDYNYRWWIGSFFRIMRFISFFIALILPAIYISIVSFHYEVIPIDLVYALQGSLENVPYPPIFEAMIMQFTLELLREAAIRLPSPIAQTIGIVGGLVIGTAVVQANLVSNTMIIVVSLTAIASFVLPSIEISIMLRLTGFPLMILAGMFGFFGITFGLMILFIHLCKLETFGQPYFAPFAPLRFVDLKDTFIRLPVWTMDKRPLDPEPLDLEREYNSRGWKKNDNE